jgi:hypothetical protein
MMAESQGWEARVHKIQKKKLYDQNCKTCQTSFKTNRKDVVYCCYSCSKAKMPDYDKIKTANQKWLNSEPKKPKKNKISFTILNRQAEWKRVWDDDSWSKKFNMYRG